MRNLSRVFACISSNDDIHIFFHFCASPERGLVSHPISPPSSKSIPGTSVMYDRFSFEIQLLPLRHGGINQDQPCYLPMFKAKFK